jgi:hypothetical protein
MIWVHPLQASIGFTERRKSKREGKIGFVHASAMVGELLDDSRKSGPLLILNSATGRIRQQLIFSFNLL